MLRKTNARIRKFPRDLVSGVPTAWPSMTTFVFMHRREHTDLVRLLRAHSPARAWSGLVARTARDGAKASLI